MLQLETTYFKRNEYASGFDIYPGKLRVSTTNHIYYLDIKDIVRIQSLSNYSKLFFSNGQTLTVAKVLGYFEDLLGPHDFLRIHRTHLINLSYLKLYVSGVAGLVAMSNDEELPVSRRKKRALHAKMMTLSL